MFPIVQLTAFLRDAGGVLIGLMFGYWMLCIPFVFFTIDKIIKLIRKIY